MKESGRAALELSWKSGRHPFPHQPLYCPSVGGT